MPSTLKERSFFLQVNSYLVDVTSENTRTARFFVLLTLLWFRWNPGLLFSRPFSASALWLATPLALSSRWVCNIRRWWSTRLWFRWKWTKSMQNWSEEESLEKCLFCARMNQYFNFYDMTSQIWMTSRRQCNAMVPNRMSQTWTDNVVSGGTRNVFHGTLLPKYPRGNQQMGTINIQEYLRYFLDAIASSSS